MLTLTMFITDISYLNIEHIDSLGNPNVNVTYRGVESKLVFVLIDLSYETVKWTDQVNEYLLIDCIRR